MAHTAAFKSSICDEPTVTTVIQQARRVWSSCRTWLSCWAEVGLVGLSNEISRVQYDFKRMRLIGFSGWTLVITSTISKSLNMSMLQLGPQYVGKVLARESNHCLFIIIIRFLKLIRLCDTASLWEIVEGLHLLFFLMMCELFLTPNSIHFTFFLSGTRLYPGSLYLLEMSCETAEPQYLS